MDIKPGFLLRITSWENDGDNYKTVSLDGLTLELVRFYVEFCKLFRSVNSSPGLFGNKEIDRDDQLQDVVHQLALKYNIYDVHQFPEDMDWSDFQYDIIGRSNCGDYYRVFDSAEVFYLAETAKNVTKAFIENTY